ncbi:MAG: NUDIX hydrolase [Bacteroidales bacterium]|nr:NUDIX hydrolase [Bacteroidales bacterium]MBQ3438485.1 NUDIX hydrolase [Bacteroidales bacterium]
MYTYQYPHPAVTTDCVIFGYDLREGLSILLVQRGIDPFKGRWAFPGGFLRMDEDADTGARRELMEETGFEAESITQFGAFTAVDRDPRERVITIAYLALVRKGDVQGGDDAADARWFPVTAVPPLAFDHDRILRIALERLKEQIHFRPVGFELLPEVFTMSQLQALYEAILGVRFDRRNFASKMLKLGLLQPTGQRPADAARRIPQLYRFNLQKYDDLKQSGFRLEF